ncbi:MAG: ATP-dependent protease ATPase subunit HslU [Gammaproteobacteria bacterium]|nr:ATP-dependent protease ATPase subunit HslU [Gammaproteobacteria bacterium]
MVMTPRETVGELNKFIIGQDAAKRAVAIALRNRWRRMQVDEAMRDEITPKNILMIGPTGVGKTEIARRLARLTNAPFVKVEATKFTEVGYVGRDVDSIIRDLVEAAITIQRESAMTEVQSRADHAAEERILDALLKVSSKGGTTDPANGDEAAIETRDWLRQKLRNGDLDDREVEIDVASQGVKVLVPGMGADMDDLSDQIQSAFENITGGSRRKTAKLSVKDAWRRAREEEASNLLNEDEIHSNAINQVEDSGIVFLDEIDKVASRDDFAGRDIAHQGVQRDLLPIIEGSTVTTRYGSVKTDHILFIASGAFHLSKPSDLIPELQGRLPIRVELNALTPDDFERILTDTDVALTKQYEALLATDGITVEYTADAVRRIAEIAFEVNENTENIGARRLHTIMERLMDEVSFSAGDTIQAVKIDANYVNEHLEELAKDQDLSRFIL